MIVTLKRLRDLGACEPGLDRFRDEFGGRAKVTRERLQMFGDHMNWIATHVFPEHARAYQRAKGRKVDDIYGLGEYNLAKANLMADLLGLP